jgi:predicted acetyltransferase
VTDPLGFADGTFLLEAGADGAASVTVITEADAAPAGTGDDATLRLGIGELGSIYLGGYRPSVLAAAGHIDAGSAALALADRLFAAERTPHLSIWF